MLYMHCFLWSLSPETQPGIAGGSLGVAMDVPVDLLVEFYCLLYVYWY